MRPPRGRAPPWRSPLRCHVLRFAEHIMHLLPWMLTASQCPQCPNILIIILALTAPPCESQPYRQASFCPPNRFFGPLLLAKQGVIVTTYPLVPHGALCGQGQP